MVRDTYCDTVNDVVSVVAGSSMPSLVEEDDHWILSDILLSRNADIRASLHMDFNVTQTRCCKCNIAIDDKASAVLGLALRGLHAL